MMGSFLTRGLAMVFGYAYPAYECFKTVEKNKPDIEQLRFWCQYWILVALMTIFERVGDAFISWVPMYSEAKLAFFIYLWYPKTKGTTYVYDSFFRPYLAKHETEIDRNLLELRTRAEDFAVMYWQKAASYGQTRVFEILQYIASQSSSRPRPAQRQPHGEGACQPPAAVSPRQPATTRQQPQQPPSHTSSASSTQQQQDAAQPAGPPPAPAAAPVASASHSKTAAAIQSAATTAAAIHLQTTAACHSAAESSSQSTKNEAEAMVTETASSLPRETGNPPPKETIMEAAQRVTRGRLKRNNAAASR